MLINIVILEPKYSVHLVFEGFGAARRRKHGCVMKREQKWRCWHFQESLNMTMPFALFKWKEMLNQFK